MAESSFNKNKFLKMTFYEVLRGTVNMQSMAKYFGYKIDYLGNISATFGAKEKQEIHLNCTAKCYTYVESGKWGGNFVDFFIKASIECFGIEYDGWQAMKEIKRLLIKNKLRDYDEHYLYALKHYIHKNKYRGKDKAPREKRTRSADYEKPKRPTRWHPLESWEHYSDYNAE